MSEETIPQAVAADVVLDQERQGKAREVATIHHRLFFVDLALGAIYVLVWLLTPLSLIVRDWVMSITTNPWLSVPLFAAAFGIPYLLINLPLSFYSGYILPHRYGQSNETLAGWITDLIKGLAVAGVLGLILLEVIYWLLRAAPDLWWLYAAGVMLFFGVILSTLAPVVLAPIFFKFTPLEDQDLAQRLTKLAERAGTKVKGVYRFNMSKKTKGANAALAGLGTTRRIILGDTLLDEFTADEIETVLAHELGHHVHRDIPLGIIIDTVLTLFSFWLAHLALNWGVQVFGLKDIADPAGLPLMMVVVAVISLLVMPLGNAWSRWRERMADRYALESTRMPKAFADAMTRLANQNLAEADPAAWVVFLLHSHPPINERVAAAQAFASQR
jgi:STE24 endopeptidase